MRRGVTFGEALRVLALGLLGRCPSCRRASMFRGWIEIHERCPNCGLKYEVESGAWLGTMAIAYGVGAGVAVALTLIEATWHPIANAGLHPLWTITALGIFSVLPAYRPAKGLWFALLWLYEFTEGGRPTATTTFGPPPFFPVACIGCGQPISRASDKRNYCGTPTKDSLAAESGTRRTPRTEEPLEP